MARWSRYAEELSSTRYPALLAYAMILAGDRAAAEDLVADALVRTFGRPRRLANVGQAEAYVRRAILTAFLDGARRSASRTRAYTRVAEPLIEPARENAIDDREEMLAALAQLAPQVRACVVLRFYDDLPVAEVAHRAGIAVGTAKRYLHDGMAALRIELDDAEIDGDDSHRDTVTIVAPGSRGARRMR